MIETLLYVCVMWAFIAQHLAKHRTAHRQVLFRVIGFQRRIRTDDATLSYARALNTSRSESIETTIHKWRLFIAGGVARQSTERLPSQVMFGTMAGGDNPRPGGQFKT